MSTHISVAEYRRLAKKPPRSRTRALPPTVMIQDVERCRDACTYVLSVAPGVNNLYRNKRGGGRVKTKRYREWIKGNLARLVSQRAKPMVTPVSISILLPMISAGDIDGKFKATTDILKRAGIIPDDSPAYVRAQSITFGQVDSMHVAIEPYVGAA